MSKTTNNRTAKPSLPTRRRIIRSLKVKADAERTLSQKLADWFTAKLGSIEFLIVNVVWFILWVFINSGVLGIKPFDPFPFGLLTMIVSLEAIILATVVLISQNRAGQIADLREEMDLQVDEITEEEITKVLQMLGLIMKKKGIKIPNDPVLQKMLQPTNVSRLEKTIEKQVMHNK